METEYNPFEKIEMAEKKVRKMSLKQARDIVGNAAEWEMKMMVKALGKFPLLNTVEENIRLFATKKVLRAERARSRRSR